MATNILLTEEVYYYIAVGLFTLAAVVCGAKVVLGRLLGTSHSGMNSQEQKSGIDQKNLSSKRGQSTESSEKVTEDEDFDDVDDLLIKSSDIELLDATSAQKLLEEEGGDASNAPTHNSPLKKVRAKDLEEEVAKGMSPDQLEEEQRVRQNQLEAIFKLMQDNKERFGVNSIDEVQNQYHLYA